MEILKNISTFFFSLSFHIDTSNELSAYGSEGILRPLKEPIDGTAIDQRREISDSGSEGVANRGETQDNVQIFLDLLDENGVQLGRGGFSSARGTGNRTHKFLELDFLISGPDIGHFIGVQQVVDIFYETLVFDLGVREEEHSRRLFASGHLEHFLDIVIPVLF
jgi:hypothetical protein